MKTVQELFQDFVAYLVMTAEPQANYEEKLAQLSLIGRRDNMRMTASAHVPELMRLPHVTHLRCDQKGNCVIAFVVRSEHPSDSFGGGAFMEVSEDFILLVIEPPGSEGYSIINAYTFSDIGHKYITAVLKQADILKAKK